MHHLDSRWTLLFVVFAAVACGGTQLRENRVHEVQQAIRLAEQAGAAEHPPSAHLLALARREAMLSRAAADDGDESNAALLLERSAADAELAYQLVLTRDGRESARATWSEVLASELD